MLGSLGLGCASTLAGSATYDFNEAPPADLQFVGSAEWRSSGGVNDSGYVSLFDAVGGLAAAVMLPDFDSGLIVKAFTFEVDLRVGNPTTTDGRPADGFSINYARAGDNVIGKLAQEPPVAPDYNADYAGAPEMGTRTGLAIGFDTWAGNALPDGPDIEGIIVRLDNKTILRYGMPTRNGACNDATSLQTGPQTTDYSGSADGLCWAPLKVALAEDGKLTVTWKGTTVLNAYETGFVPSAGRIIFAGRTGGNNENTHIDNVKITTIPADTMLIGTATGNAFGFQFSVNDSGASVLDPATLVVKLDGTTVTPTLYKPATAVSTLVDYTSLATRLAAGSSHTVEVTSKDVHGKTVTKTSTVVIPDYVLIPASYAVSGTPTVPGMKATTFMIDEASVTGFTGRYPNNENISPNAEEELAAGYVDPTDSVAYPNFADPVKNDITTVNWEQAGGDIDATNPDNFNSMEPVDSPVPNDPIPGISTTGPNDNIVVEVTSYMQLKRGVTRLGVNSDDGFKVTVAPGQPSVTGVQLGIFNDGRGASDSIFDAVVDADGYYPIRLLYWGGNGGENCEWFSVDRITGVKTLINGTGANAIKTFRNGAGRAAVKSILPSDAFAAVQGKDKIQATLIDGSTTVVDGSIKLVVDGTDVTSKATIANGATTTVTYAPVGGWKFDTAHTWQLVWSESGTPATEHTENFSFNTRRLAPDDLPSYTDGSFWIEAEDWDYDNGKAVDAANTMPYTGAAYDGLAGVLNVDYWDNQNDGDGGINFTYRTDQRPNHVNVADNTGGRFGVDRPGDTDLTVNYKLGWMGDFWGNYTRKVPAGVYTAYAALSIDNSNADAMKATFQQVTEGVGTSSQTLAPLGTFVGRGNGAWSSNELSPLKDAEGNPKVFKIKNAQTTFRVTATSGDFDWFVLVPVTTAPPQLVNKEPKDLLFPVDRNAVIKWNFEDYSTKVNTSSVALKVNGTAAPAAEVTVAKVGDITTVSYDPAALFDIGKTYTYELTYKDTAGTSFTKTGSWIAHYMPASPENMFLVEAEDFNTGGGQVIPAANSMPYLGDAYNGLAAVAGTDYDRTDTEGSGDIYRLGETPNIPMSQQNDENGTVRARDAAGNPTWVVTNNYRLGWAGGGRWMDYTRTIPAGQYQVWASVGYGETPSTAVRCMVNLSKVTSDPTQGSQTTEAVGFIRGSATGGWGINTLQPLRATDSASGDALVLTVGGTTTFRAEYANGDFDYLIFVPVGQIVQSKLGIPTVDGANVTFTWTGAGTLQSSEDLVTWTDVPGATSPRTVNTASAAKKFYRLKN